MASYPWELLVNVNHNAHSPRDHQHTLHELLAKFLTWRGVLEDKVFIIKLPAIDGFATGAVVVGEVTSLAHKLRDDAMKAAALKAKSFLMCAQAAEILYIGCKKRCWCYYVPTEYLVFFKGE